MLAETTTISSTLSTLDTYGADEDLLTTVGSSLTTSLTAMPNYRVHNYYYYGDSYVKSLSDIELAKLESKLVEKEESLEKNKILTLR